MSGLTPWALLTGINPFAIPASVFAPASAFDDPEITLDESENDMPLTVFELNVWSLNENKQVKSLNCK